MTEQDVWKTLDRLAKSQEETDRQLKEMAAEANRRAAEDNRRAAEDNRRAAEADRRAAEADLRAAEADRRAAELDRRFAETDQQISRVSKLVGDIGNNFGRFTEGMAEPSMRKLLKKFGMTAFHPRALFHSEKGDRTLEVDVLGYDASDRREEVYIVEVKSRLTPDAVTQALKTIADFRELGPSALRHRPVYGVIAAVDIPQDLDKTVTSRGLYLARINDDTFQLLTPDGFKPKLFTYEPPPAEKSKGRANGHSRKKKLRKK
jgi:hypothetical protein